MSIDKILLQREKTHGKFEDVAGTIQYLKYGMQKSKNWNNLSMEQKESLEMIVHKIGRILNGDPDTKDHWDDIAGYATLIANTAIEEDWKPIDTVPLGRAVEVLREDGSVNKYFAIYDYAALPPSTHWRFPSSLSEAA